MNSSLRKIGRLLLVAAISLGVSEAKAQLKVGDQPTNIQPSAILELQSTQQGLLLTRLTDTVAINAIVPTPPDGMIIYLTKLPNAGMYVRRGGHWEMLANTTTALNNWSLAGNALNGGEFLGSTNAQDVIFKANGTEKIRLTSAGDLNLSGVPANTAETSVLLIKTDGTVVQRTISNNAFLNAIGSMTLNTGTSYTDATVVFDATNGGNTLNLPIMAGTTGQNYGFLTIADWNKIQALDGNNISVADYVTIAAAATDPKRGIQISYDATTKKYTINLIEADVNHAGIVTTLAQTFGGDKTFNDNLLTNKNLTVTGTSTLTGDVSASATLSVTGTSLLTGKVTTGTDLAVGGAATVANGVNVTTGGLTVAAGGATITGPIKLPSLPATTVTAPADLNVLVSNGGTIEYKKLNNSAFDGAIRVITNGTTPLKDSAITFVVDTLKDNFKMEFDATTGANKVIFHQPDASGDAAGAGGIRRGLVNTGVQSFAGNKSFLNSVAVGTVAAPVSTLDVQGSVSTKFITKATSYTLTAADNVIYANPAAGVTVTLTLPATAASAGRIYTVKKVAGGNTAKVIIAAAGADAIEDGTTYPIYNDWTFVSLQSDGAGHWYVIKH